MSVSCTMSVVYSPYQNKFQGFLIYLPEKINKSLHKMYFTVIKDEIILE